MKPFQSSLKGKVGILTGGTSGFGFRIAKEISTRGANLAVFSIDELTEEARKDFDSVKDSEVAFLKKDILTRNAADEMVNETVEMYGKLDFVIANAGLAIRFEEPLIEMPSEKIAEAMRNQFEMFPIALATLDCLVDSRNVPKLNFPSRVRARAWGVPARTMTVLPRPNFLMRSSGCPSKTMDVIMTSALFILFSRRLTSFSGRRSRREYKK